MDGRYENSAEHSWHVAMMALVLGNYASPTIDLFKVLKMLLIHDLVEIYAGDTWLYETNQKNKYELELESAEQLFSLLPSEQEKEFFQLWEEFENNGSEEAKYAKAVDGLQPLINHLDTAGEPDNLLSVGQVEEKKKHIGEYSPILGDLVKEIILKSVNKGLYR